MKLLLLAILLVSSAKSETKTVLYPDHNSVSGALSGYAENVMDESIAYYDGLNYGTWCGFECRQEADLDGYIVVAHCNRIGSIASLQIDNLTHTVLVADCIAQDHIVSGNIFDRGYIGELDYNLFNLVGRHYGTLTY